LNASNDIDEFHIGIEQTNTNLRITRQGSVLATGTTSLAADTWYFLEIKADPANSGGNAELRINRNVDISFTGDTSWDGGTAFGAVSFMGATRIVYYDDIYILDTTGSVNNDYINNSFGDVKIRTLLPNGAGNSTEFSVIGAANNHSAVGISTPNDDTSYVHSSSTARDTYTVEDLSTSASEIFGIQNCVSNRKDGPSNEIISSVIRTGSTDYLGNTTFMLTDYENSCVIYDQNPNTSLDWTISDINNIEIGIDVYKPTVTLQGSGSISAVGTVT
jgi:hypothetical protein